MSDQIVPVELTRKIADLYHRMEEAYDKVAAELDFSCQGCPDNCCDSYFQHHTYIEWAYLWDGVMALPEDRREELLARAKKYVEECATAISHNERPQAMCPLIDDGLCSLYAHRLMICRMHGVPSAMTRPDGQAMRFPGCFRCQEITGNRHDLPVVERTDFYRELVALEVAFLGPRRNLLPKVKMTLAEMLVQGPPKLP